jgi:hypothetical protein
MARLRSLLACLLLALWLPATLHCALQEAGVLRETKTCTDHCVLDNCGQLETGLPAKFTSVALQAPAFVPVLFAWRPGAFAPDLAFVAELPRLRITCPPELARTWQFTVRAAPLPGAPSLAS